MSTTRGLSNNMTTHAHLCFNGLLSRGIGLRTYIARALEIAWTQWTWSKWEMKAIIMTKSLIFFSWHLLR